MGHVRARRKHRNELHEHVAQLALAFRAGLANRTSGSSFSVEIADPWNDARRGTDLFLHRDSKSRRIDFTEGGHRTISKKIRRAWGKTRGGGVDVLIVHLRREDVFGIATDPCYLEAYDCLLASRRKVFIPEKEREVELVALPEACPKHGNACAFAGKLLALSNYLNAQLRGRFRIDLPEITPLPKR